MESLDKHSTNTADTSNTYRNPQPQNSTKNKQKRTKRDTTPKEALTSGHTQHLHSTITLNNYNNIHISHPHLPSNLRVRYPLVTALPSSLVPWWTHHETGWVGRAREQLMSIPSCKHQITQSSPNHRPINQCIHNTYSSIFLPISSIIWFFITWYPTNPNPNNLELTLTTWTNLQA